MPVNAWRTHRHTHINIIVIRVFSVFEHPQPTGLMGLAV